MWSPPNLSLGLADYHTICYKLLSVVMPVIQKYEPVFYPRSLSEPSRSTVFHTIVLAHFEERNIFEMNLSRRLWELVGLVGLVQGQASYANSTNPAVSSGVLPVVPYTLTAENPLCSISSDANLVCNSYSEAIICTVCYNYPQPTPQIKERGGPTCLTFSSQLPPAVASVSTTTTTI